MHTRVVGIGRKKALGFLGGVGIGAAAGGPVGAVVGGLIGTLVGDNAEHRDEIMERRLKTKHYACDDCDYEWTSKKSFGRAGYCPKCRCRDIELVD